MILYIGPGVGLTTIVIVAIVVVIILASLFIVLMRPIKRWIAKLQELFNG